MKYAVFFILVAAAAWYYFFSRDVTPAEGSGLRLVQAAPEKRFAAVLATTPVEADKLGPLCQAYPQIAAQVLKNRQFKMHGVIKDFRLTGIEGRRAEILLRTDTNRQLIILYDLDQYFRLALNNRKSGKYSIVDTELFYIRSDGLSKLLFAKETEVSQLVVTKSFGVTNVSFLAVVSAPSVGIF